MKVMMKLCLILFLMGWIIYMYVQPRSLNDHGSDNELPKVELQRNEQKEEIDINTYLIGVVGSEMSPTYEMEALKAQCVAARTFLIHRHYQVDDTTSSQVYRDKTQLQQAWGNQYEEYYQKIEKAVLATANEIITYDGKVITALYHAQSCGKTANAQEYYGTDYPYLRSVDSSSDMNEQDHIQTSSYDVASLMQALQLDEAPFQVKAPIRYDSGYVKSWEINDQIYSGREVREALSLRSSAFEVSFDGNLFVFTTKGYGHGVGMSQKGANAMAKEGYDYVQILKHYYQGVEITKQ